MLHSEERKQIENEILFRRVNEKVIKGTKSYSVVKKNNVIPKPKFDAEFNKTGLENSHL